MTPQEITRVRTSFAKVAPIAPQAAELFYGRLFEIAPEVKPLFAATDLKEQGRKLMGTLTFVVGALDRLDELVPAAQNLAVRHTDYGVKNEHYAPVGAALLWTLDQGLGDAFDAETEAAWTKAYSTLSAVMIDAANAQAA
ncbi:globin family protein [Notoacmeibacter sp. MSK16QG-6]|uniref:globin family protein n=1 Tax=Notoacmeibacter sp. MSK16QG-6 TaxID=2957982 RepID=UPI0020A1A9B1|nr:globin family protein [Notoacmeibacter sp. MSK16QG-6]MCP1199673.1 globin domain-containing protein [Notoacmeibacter sp. MSK16QG-6]